MIAAAGKVLRSGMTDLLRSRGLVVHGAFFLVATWGLLYFSEDAAATLVSLANLVVLVLPLVGLVFGTMYFYASRDFVELLLAQPIDRRSVFLGHYLGLALPLAFVFVTAVALPFLGYRLAGRIELDSALPMLLLAGVLLVFVTTSLASRIALRFDNRVMGLGVALLVWLGLSFLYDGVILVVAVVFRSFALERPVLGLVLLNPLDLARIAILLRLDVAALMGFTGALFQRLFGSGVGTVIVVGALLVQLGVPFALGLRAFKRKDF
jgi:Cu-processing system permease protein